MISISLFCRMDEMMKGAKGWKEIQILKGDNHGNGSSKARGINNSDNTTAMHTESNDDNWAPEEV